MTSNPNLSTYFQSLVLPATDSHKGQNGKLLIIGGSELFHAASKWSLDIASKCVDMVFYASVPGNNELVKEAKGEFWNGIVIARAEINSYIAEADCVLIGPGMTRDPETEEITNRLLKQYPEKKWVIDAGALQMIDPSLLNERCLITPHKKEFRALYRKRVLQLGQPQPDGSYAFTFGGETSETTSAFQPDSDQPLWFEDAIFGGIENYDELSDVERHNFKQYFIHASKLLNGATIIIKGPSDFVGSWQGEYPSSIFETITGGHPGMTKGGTGDVLAGLVAGLYCTQDVTTAAMIGSVVNKKAGEALAEKVGPFFNASDLVNKIPEVLWESYQTSRNS